MQRSSFIQRKLMEHQRANGDIRESAPVDTRILQQSAFGDARRTRTAAAPQTNSSASSNNKRILIEDLNQPVINQALSRLVVRDLEKRNIVRMIIKILFIKLFRSVYDQFVSSYIHQGINKLKLDNRLNKLNWAQKKLLVVIRLSLDSYNDEICAIFKWLEFGLYTLILLSIVVSIYKLLKPLDSCEDLPLTNKQRQLIGLEPLPEEEDIDVLDKDWVNKTSVSNPGAQGAHIQIDLETLPNEVSQLDLGGF